MKQHFIVPVKHCVGLWVLWTSCDQGGTLFILCVDDPLYPILALLLFYSWDLLIHYEGWMETRESIRRRFLCWRSISGVWPIVMLQSACRGFASAEVFISFFACVTCFRCLSAYWWLFAPWHCNMHQLKIKKKKISSPLFCPRLTVGSNSDRGRTKRWNLSEEDFSKSFDFFFPPVLRIMNSSKHNYAHSMMCKWW